MRWNDVPGGQNCAGGGGAGGLGKNLNEDRPGAFVAVKLLVVVVSCVGACLFL